MAARYWVGGGASTNWNATGNTNWAATSGGANNASVPGSSDDVFLDGNSGVGNSNISATITIKSLTTTGYVGTITHNNFVVNIIDSLTFSPGFTYTVPGTGFFAFTGTGIANTITSAGKTIARINISSTGTGAWTLADNLNLSVGMTITRGTLSAATFNVSTPTLSMGGASAKQLNAGSGTWTISGGGTPFNITAAATTFVAQTSTFVFSSLSDDSKQINTSGLTFYKVAFNANAGSSHEYLFVDYFNVSNNITINGKNKLTFVSTLSYDFSAATITINSGASTIVTLQGDAPGVNQWGIVGGGGIYNLSYLNIIDSAATNGTWNATHSIDNGNNTGWNITNVMPTIQSTGSISTYHAAGPFVQSTGGKSNGIAVSNVQSTGGL